MASGPHAMILRDAFAAPYQQRALLALVVLGVLAGVVGVHVQLRRLSFAADAMTHTVFPGVAIAAAVGGSLLVGALIAAGISAVVLALTARVKRIPADAMLALLIGSFFSVGIIVVSRRHSFSTDLTGLLFGRLLFVSRNDLLSMTVLLVVVAVLLALTGKELVLRAFDADTFEAMGYRQFALDVVLHFLIALVVVAGSRAVGTALMVSLLLLPPAIAQLWTNRVISAMVAAAAVAVGAGGIGLLVSFDASVNHNVRLAPGPTVVVVLAVTYLAAVISKAVIGRAMITARGRRQRQSTTSVSPRIRLREYL
jgi:manganese/iron transport system permease protein